MSWYRLIRLWRRGGLMLRVALFFLVSLTLSLLIYWQRPVADTDGLGSNLLIFAIVNFNLVIICILIFLVGRNVVKLIFDRRKNILGSKLRLKLVMAFVGLALVPTCILFFLASGLLSRALDDWFSNQIESAVSSSVDVAREHYITLKDLNKRALKKIKLEVENKPLVYSEEELTRRYFIKIKDDYGVDEVHLYSIDGSLVISEPREFRIELGLDKSIISRALEKAGEAVLADSDRSSVVQVYALIQRGQKKEIIAIVKHLPSGLQDSMRIVNEAFREYGQLKMFKNPVRSSYLLTLAMIACLILFSAIWFGFYIARELTVPIQRLAEGTQAVARGDLDYTIRPSGNDEISFLVRSFNKMTADLRYNRSELERRRVYTETILSNLAVGVIGIDSAKKVTSINQAAAKIFSIPEMSRVLGESIDNVLGDSVYSQVSSMTELALTPQGKEDNYSVYEKNLTLLRQDRELSIICTVGALKDPESEILGVILLFDDITELNRAQQLSVWREAARRIAHEIKNPLTPIKLSAQRLRNILGSSFDNPAIEESTKTIVEHVDSIKRLADEFSRFARMPDAEFSKENIRSIISQHLTSYVDRHADISFQFIPGRNVPDIEIDKEQIRRLILNLLDNAINAIRESKNMKEAPRVVIRTSYLESEDKVLMEFSDNGPGIPNRLKSKVFEPYYTSSSKGTGLGLAIVSTIVGEHQGLLRLVDKEPSGISFVIELPVKQVSKTHRKLSQGFV